MSRIRYRSIAAIAVLPILLLCGCPALLGPMSGDDLTDIEKDGILASVWAEGAIAQAGAVIAAAADSFARINDLLPGSDLVFGSCPVVTLRLGAGGLTAVDITLEFGAGCAPTGNNNFICSGNATGTINLLTRELSLTFNSTVCNTRTLTGTVDVIITPTAEGAELSGDFNVRVTDGAASFHADGAAVVAQNRAAQTSRIGSFDGCIGNSTGDFETAFADITVSAVSNANLIAQGGTVELVREMTRDITVRFNADSPTTFNIDISVDGGPFFVLSLSEL